MILLVRSLTPGNAFGKSAATFNICVTPYFTREGLS